MDKKGSFLCGQLKRKEEKGHEGPVHPTTAPLEQRGGRERTLSRAPIPPPHRQLSAPRAATVWSNYFPLLTNTQSLNPLLSPHMPLFLPFQTPPSSWLKNRRHRPASRPRPCPKSSSHPPWKPCQKPSTSWCFPTAAQCTTTGGAWQCLTNKCWSCMEARSRP